ncbi:hypothetical protein VP01_4706g1 [Puccinia sorghi]|uniref:Uncharacterized protein n=1 Tax=Puccinia sorghi TaxID=27349 RepID=A0A0L6UN08_9BASI|nr:hypothetical protein VP01_4706g1 [Puccinia sorghi]
MVFLSTPPTWLKWNLRSWEKLTSLVVRAGILICDHSFSPSHLSCPTFHPGFLVSLPLLWFFSVDWLERYPLDCKQTKNMVYLLAVTIPLCQKSHTPSNPIGEDMVSCTEVFFQKRMEICPLNHAFEEGSMPWIQYNSRQWKNKKNESTIQQILASQLAMCDQPGGDLWEETSNKESLCTFTALGMVTVNIQSPACADTLSMGGSFSFSTCPKVQVSCKWKKLQDTYKAITYGPEGLVSYNRLKDILMNSASDMIQEEKEIHEILGKFTIMHRLGICRTLIKQQKDILSMSFDGLTEEDLSQFSSLEIRLVYTYPLHWWPEDFSKDCRQFGLDLLKMLKMLCELCQWMKHLRKSFKS